MSSFEQRRVDVGLTNEHIETGARLEDRKRRLSHLIKKAGIGSLADSEAFTNGEGLLLECGSRGLEGVVAKHRASIYRSGRSVSWVKVKCPAWREANRNRGELFGESK